jgi:ABC-2 type transport system permease protein
MNLRIVFAVFKKDISEIRKDQNIMVSMAVVPLFLGIILPFFAKIIPKYVLLNLKRYPVLDMYGDKLSSLPPSEGVLLLLVNYLFPVVFMLIPTIIANVIAVDSFAGEYERKTIEALLAAPISCKDLFMGKLLVSFFPSIIITWASAFIYLVLVKFLILPSYLSVYFPPVEWFYIILLLSPLFSAFSMIITMILSARIGSVKGAQQVSGLVAVPVLILAVSQVTGVFMLSRPIMVGIALLFLVGDVSLFYIGALKFNPYDIIGKI